MPLKPVGLQVSSDWIDRGQHRLHRFSVVPNGPIAARIVLLHGYGDHAGKYLHVLSWFAERGVAASAVDFRGHGRSTGRVAHVKRWDEYLDDLKAMLSVESVAFAPASDGAGTPAGEGKAQPETASENINQTEPAVAKTRTQTAAPPPLFIVAHSHGALIAIMAALRGMLNDIAGVIMSAPYLELKIPVPAYKRIFAGIASKILPAVAIRSGIDGPMLTHDAAFIEINKTDPYCPGFATPRWFTTTRQMQIQARKSAGSFKLPLLMLLAGEDVIADSRASTAFFEQAGSTDKQLKVYPEYRHEILREVGREAVFQTMLDWIKRPVNVLV